MFGTMLTRVLVFVLGVTSVLADHHKVKCNGINSASPESLPSLAGGWVGISTVRFKDGHENIPENDNTPNVCMHAKASHVSGLVIENEVTVRGQNAVKETLTLSPINDDKGRFSVVSSINDYNNWEFIIIDVNSNKHLVYMLCEPPKDGDRLPARINLFARHVAGTDQIAITEDDIKTIIRNVAEKVGLTGSGIQPVRFGTFCWSHYEEHHHH